MLTNTKMRISRRRRAQQLTKLLDAKQRVKSFADFTTWVSEARDASNFHQPMLSVQEAMAAYESTAAHTAWREFERIRQRVDVHHSLRHYEEKVDAFQLEITRAATANAERDIVAQVREIQKASAFMRLRDENYAASLRLEGLDPVPHSALTTLSALHAKYAR